MENVTALECPTWCTREHTPDDLPPCDEPEAGGFHETRYPDATQSGVCVAQDIALVGGGVHIDMLTPTRDPMDSAAARSLARALIGAADELDDIEAKGFAAVQPDPSRRDVRGPGVALATLRKAGGLTVEQASSLAGAASSYWHRVERGEVVPTDGWFRMVSTALAEAVEALPPR